MSREILAFSIFAGAAAVCAVAAGWESIGNLVPAVRAAERFLSPASLVNVSALGTAALGVVSVYCSAMIYVDTRRPFWARERTFPRFFGTAALLGSAATACLLGWMDLFVAADLRPLAVWSAAAATFIRTALFGWDIQNLAQALRDERSPAYRPSLIMWKLLKPLVATRAALFFGSTGFGVAAMATGGTAAAVCASLSLLLTAASQVIERYFYFVAADPPRMPGGIAT